MRPAIIGFGELGVQIAAMIDLSMQPEHPIIFDDIAYQNGMPGAHPFDDYAHDEYAACQFYVCLGYKHLQRKDMILAHLSELGRSIPAHYAHVYVNRSASIGPGVVIYPMSNIDKDAYIGRGCLLNNSVVVSHNCRIGECCYLSPGVVLSGYVSIGAYTFVGAGSVVANNISIGRNVRIGIGTVVTADLPDDASVIGNPMRILSQKLRVK